MAVNIDKDKTYGKYDWADFNADTTTVNEVGGDETVLVIDVAGSVTGTIGAMAVYEYFEGKWYKSTNTFIPA